MKKRGNISKMILEGIFLAGIFTFATASPYFLSRAIPRLAKYTSYRIRNKKHKKEIKDVFYYLKRRGLITISNKGGQVYISLTNEGRKKAGKYQIDDLKIKKDNKWNKKWWVLIFDIKERDKLKREALRGKIKELGLFQMQKSVWVYPYRFQKEIETLRSFFNLTKEEMKVIIASKIENSEHLRKHFRI